MSDAQATGSYALVDAADDIVQTTGSYALVDAADDIVQTTGNYLVIDLSYNIVQTTAVYVLVDAEEEAPMTAIIAGYVIIDSKRYKVQASDYKRGFEPPKTARRGVLGNTIVSIGPGSTDRDTSAVLFIPYEPEYPWGSINDLEIAAVKASVSYTDHITDDVIKWGSGTYDITILRAEVIHLQNAPRPEPGYQVYVEWLKVLS